MGEHIHISQSPPEQPGGAPQDAAENTFGDIIDQITEICERAANGDLEARICGLVEDPSFGRMVNSINHLLNIADSFVREASAAMSHCSREQFHRPILLRGMPGAYRQSAIIINQAGLKMLESSEQAAFVAHLANETADSATTVAAACEELRVTTKEISRQTSNSAQLTQSAVNDAGNAEEAAQHLSETTKKVEDMVGLIKKVAGQTNLLALNATIEAARAGEYGRGFAVVANEVKELSRNTAKATEDIRKQVESMQNAVDEVQEFVERINQQLKNIDGNAGFIASSVEEQVKATNEISRSINEVSRNTTQVSDRIARDRNKIW